MRLILLENDCMVQEVLCDEGVVSIGSQEGCRLRLADARVAPQQALVYSDGHHWVLQQLHPETAILVNGVHVTDRVQLRTGDEIHIADYVIRAYPEHRESRPPRPATEAAGGRSGTPIAQLNRFVQYQLPPGAVVKKADEGLSLQPGHLPRIGQMNLGLSQCITVEPFMDLALRFLLESFSACRAWLGVRRVNYGPMEYVEGRHLTGQPLDLPEAGERLKPRVLDRAQFLLLPRVSPEERMSVLAGPLLGPEGTLGMLYLDSGDGPRRFDLADLDYFIVLSHLMGLQLDAIFKHIARNRAAMVEGQVSVAHAIQARITPRKLPQWDQLQFGAFREPGRERSGDIYDVCRLSNQMAAFMVAHTPATGPMPSMIMAQAQATFRTCGMHLEDPHVLLRMLNVLLYDGQNDRPLDCFVAVADPASGRILYSVAGRLGAYIIGQRGEERPLLPAEPVPALGMYKDAVYPLLREQLKPLETLVLFTPGVTTARSSRGEVFGEERFVNILCDGFGQLASTMLKEMLTDLRNFTEAGTQPDDITVLLAHRPE